MQILGRVLRTILFFIFLLPRILLEMLFSRRFGERVIYFSFSPRRFRLPALGGDNPRPAMTLTTPTFGGGFYAASSRYLLDARGEGGGKVFNAQDKTIVAGGGNGDLNGGVILRLGGLRVYPLFGIGGGGDGVAFLNAARPDESSDAPKYIQPGYGKGGVRRWSGVGVELHIGGRIGMVVGLRIGGEQAFFGGASEPNVRVILGVGYFGRTGEAKQEDSAE